MSSFSSNPTSCRFCWALFSSHLQPSHSLADRMTQNWQRPLERCSWSSAYPTRALSGTPPLTGLCFPQHQKDCETFITVCRTSQLSTQPAACTAAVLKAWQRRLHSCGDLLVLCPRSQSPDMRGTRHPQQCKHKREFVPA